MSNLSKEEKQAIDNLRYSTTTPSNETINTIVSLFDKQQKEIEVVTKSYDKALDMLVDKDNKLEDSQNQNAELKDKLEIANKIIDKMAENLTTPIHSKEWIINHYLKEVEDDKN